MTTPDADDESRPIRPDTVSGVDGPELPIVGHDDTDPDRGRSEPLYPDEPYLDAASSPYPDGGGDSVYPDRGPDRPSGWGGSQPFGQGSPRAGAHDPAAGLALAPQTIRDTYAPVQFDPASEFEPPDDLPPWYEDEYYDDREWERLPRGTSTLFRVLVFVGVFAVVVFMSGSFVKGWIDDQLDPPGEPGAEVEIAIPLGAATNDIVRILADEGIVANSTVFRYYLQYKDAGEFQAGDYVFREDMAAWEALEVLEGGARVAETFFVTVPEGLTVAELQASLLSQLPEFDAVELADAIASAPRPEVFGDSRLVSDEGIFFPATYDVPEDFAADEAALIGRMVAAFDQVATETDLGRSRRKVGVSPYQALIVASLIEEEAKVDEDRAQIAQVIYNRLEAGEILGIDATVVYALGGDRELSQSDLEVDSPYNTRRFAGLPPGPIAAPGRASIEAALNPSGGDIFYYVLTEENGPGTHRFTVTFEEFEEGRQICIQRELGCG
jgi:UPF0755 protein